MTKSFRYTGVAPSLDNHESDYYESKHWTICIWNGKVFHSKEQVQGELETSTKFFTFILLENNLIEVRRNIESFYDGYGKKYIENVDDNFPIPKYVCDFIRTLKDKYVIK